MQAQTASAEAPARRWWPPWRRWRRGRDDDAEAVRGLREERAALQAALQRRRLHDEVRHAELDELRALLRQQRGEAAAAPPPAAAAAAEAEASAWPTPAAPRTRTIEQIARIEAQMAGQWDVAAPAPAPPPAADAPRPGARLAIDLVHPQPCGALLDAWLGHPALTQAAVAFANGRTDEARRALAVLEAQSDDAALACVAGRLRLDLLWAQGDRAGFEAAAAGWGERFGQAPPPWPVASHAGVSSATLPPPRRPWVCPARLGAADLAGWDGGDAPDALDWRALQDLDAPAAAALLAACERWAGEARVLRMAGADVLLRRLKAATPSGRRDVDPLWWRLRLALLRLLERRAAHDLVALDALASVGLAPMPWRPPRARVVEVDALPPAAAEPAARGGDTRLASESEFPAMPTVLAAWPASQSESGEGRIEVAVDGVLAGDVGALLARLDAELLRDEDGTGPLPLLVLDAQGLQRIDFAAAGALLQWLLAARARGVRVEWRGVAPLIGLLLHAVGIDEVAQVRLRQ